MQGVLEGKIITNVEFILMVEKESKKGFKDEYSTRKEKEETFGLGAGAEASSHISLTAGASFGKGDNFDVDFYFSGVNLKVWVKAGFRKREETIREIIPYYRDNFDLLKNKGVYK